MRRAERKYLGEVIADIRAWIEALEQAQHLAAHLPISGRVPLDARATGVVTSLERVRDSGDLHHATVLLQLSWFEARRKEYEPTRAAAARLTDMHRRLRVFDCDEVLAEAHSRIAARAEDERAQLRQLVDSLDASWSQAYSALNGSAHPIIRPNPLTDAESSVSGQLVRSLLQHRDPALLLLDPSLCATGQCAGAHASAGALVEIQREGRRTAALDQIREAADRVAKQQQHDRASLAAALESLRSWRLSGERALMGVQHLPITRDAVLPASELEAIQTLASLLECYELAAESIRTGAACAAGSCGGMHVSAAVLHAFFSDAAAAGTDRLIESAASRVARQHQEERQYLTRVLDVLQSWRLESLRTLDDVAHLPLNRSGALTDSEAEVMQTLVEVVGEHRDAAGALLNASACATGACEDAHASALALQQLYGEGAQLGWGELLSAATARIEAQSRSEREAVKSLHAKVRHWYGRAKAIRESRVAADELIRSRVSALVHVAPSVTVCQTSVRLLALTEDDKQLLASLTLLRDSPLRPSDEKLLDAAVKAAISFTSLKRAAFDEDWRCARDASCVAAHEEIPGIFALSETIEQGLARLTVATGDSDVDLDDILDPALGLTTYLPGFLHSPELLGRATTERARTGASVVANAAKEADRASRSAKGAAENVRKNDIAGQLRAMDLEVLKKASPQRFRVSPLANAGLNNVWDVLEYNRNGDLEELPGLGESSAHSIAQAALRLHQGVRDETPVRIDVKRKGKRTAALLEALRAWDAARRLDPTKDEVAMAESLVRLLQREAPPTRILALAAGGQKPGNLSLNRLVEDPLDRIQQPSDGIGIWDDFLTRPADYFGMLSELGFMTEDEKKMHGDLPEEIIEAIRAQELNRGRLTASLRAYQSFGARFALVQKKVIIGDEMGLGKTVEALAVLAHLAETGHSHFLVVCPAAVVSGWMRETAKHTRLRAFRLHGAQWERNQAAKSWARHGGVAVATYDLLPWAQRWIADVEVGCGVFDEAHYIKNPLAKRSVAAAQIIASVPHAVLMTGTPLENSVEEFRNLVSYVRPDLSDSAPDYLPSKFRKHVAPAYLRRNQEDVLTELPELIEVEEWMGMSAADERIYRDAVEEGQFMLMRRAAMLSEHSLKTERLAQIVSEAEENGRRVIVFSYFRDVLTQIAELLPGEVFGPLTGSLPAAQRQDLVDRFSTAGHGAVLVAQITAGGVGLNIQSASVVVICEPQVKPTLESQAIARAHRMGQTSTVQVHRLLTENSVDDRMREMLGEKRRIFEEFARDSVIAERAPDAVDMTEAELASRVIAAERERLFGQADDSAAEAG